MISIKMKKIKIVNEYLQKSKRKKLTNCQKIIKSKNYQLVIQTKIKNQCISIGVLLLKTRWSKRLSFASNDRKSCQPMKFLDFVCSISGELLDRFSSFFDTKSHSMKQIQRM